MKTNKHLDLFDQFELTFNLPPDDGSITCRAEVLWLNVGQSGLASGMGVRFVEIEPHDKSRLEEFLKRWARRDDLLGGRYFRIFPVEESRSDKKRP